MSLREDLNIAGRLTLRAYDAEGRLVREVRSHNDITLQGRALVARLFNRDHAAEAIPRVTKICVGSGGAAFDAQANALAARVEATPIREIREVEAPGADGRTRKVLRITGELGERDANAELREAGLFTEDEEIMYNRVVFDTITKSDRFRMTLVWEIAF